MKEAERKSTGKRKETEKEVARLFFLPPSNEVRDRIPRTCVWAASVSIFFGYREPNRHPAYRRFVTYFLIKYLSDIYRTPNIPDNCFDTLRSVPADLVPLGTEKAPLGNRKTKRQRIRKIGWQKHRVTDGLREKETQRKRDTGRLQDKETTTKKRKKVRQVSCVGISPGTHRGPL